MQLILNELQKNCRNLHTQYIYLWRLPRLELFLKKKIRYYLIAR